MEQLLCHIFGDFCLQSDYFAMNKAKRSWPCFLHVLTYTACFLFLTVSWKALLVIGVTHFIIDRWPVIIKRTIWLKNHLGPKLAFPPFRKCSGTGYYDNFLNEVNNVPRDKWETSWGAYSTRMNYITIWLCIVTDNFCHLFINYMAIKYL